MAQACIEQEEVGEDVVSRCAYALLRSDEQYVQVVTISRLHGTCASITKRGKIYTPHMPGFRSARDGLSLPT